MRRSEKKKGKQHEKTYFGTLLALCMIASLAACGGADDTEEPEETASAADETLEPSEEAAEPAEETVSADAGSWSIYWYLCGSDLESGGGFATGDLSELLEVQLPEDVNVVIETGGASVWQNDVVDASKLQRWVYNSEGLQLIDEQPSASMGQAQTLADFCSLPRRIIPPSARRCCSGTTAAARSPARHLTNCMSWTL